MGGLMSLGFVVLPLTCEYLTIRSSYFIAIFPILHTLLVIVRLKSFNLAERDSVSAGVRTSTNAVVGGSVIGVEGRGSVGMTSIDVGGAGGRRGTGTYS